MKTRIIAVSMMVCVLTAFLGFTVLAADYLYLEEADLNLGPKTFDTELPSSWVSDVKKNPALLDLDGSSRFLMDLYYLGGTRKNTTDGSRRLYNVNAPYNVGGSVTASGDETYYSNEIGTTFGYALELNDMSSLAFLLDYSYSRVDGSGEWDNVFSYTGLSSGSFYGSLERDVNAHTVGMSALYNMDLNDTVSLGFGLRYAYGYEKQTNDVSGNGIQYDNALNSTPESMWIDDELIFNTHLLSPTFGVSITPTENLTINSTISAGFNLGTVDKEAVKYDDYWARLSMPGWPAIAFPTSTYTEDLDSGDVFDWGLAYTLDADYRVNDALSIPVMFEFVYDDTHWDVDGASAGYFAPYMHGYLFQGPGTIDYENDMTAWSITAGFGVEYAVDGLVVSGKAYYTHWDLSDTYNQDNLVNSNVTILVFPGGPATVPVSGLHSFTQENNETRDILSLEFSVSREFSEVFSVDFTARYDLGWGRVDMDEYYMSPYEYSPANSVLAISADDKDIFQNLTLFANLSYTPVENLSLGFSGMVLIPLDKVEYNMDGGSSGVSTTAPLHNRNLFIDGLSSSDTVSETWNYGGMFTIEYAF